MNDTSNLELCIVFVCVFVDSIPHRQTFTPTKQLLLMPQKYNFCVCFQKNYALLYIFSYFASLSFWLHLSIYAFEAISFKRFFSVKFVEMDFLRAIFLLDEITAFVSGTELSVFLVCMSWKEKNDVFARHFRHRQREYANVNYDELYRQNRTTCVLFFSAYNMRQSCKITTMNRKKKHIEYSIE